MPIIAHTTDKKLNILNSQTFIITNLSKETFSIMNDDVTQEIKIEKFHQFFYLGFCITIHASQGETFNTKYTIYDWNFTRFCEKAKYVAMSRGTNINNIWIYQYWWYLHHSIGQIIFCLLFCKSLIWFFTHRISRALLDCFHSHLSNYHWLGEVVQNLQL
jgi:hypothetical protein